MFDEYEGVSGAVSLQVELMNPLNSFSLIKEPTMENLIKSAYMPSMAYLGYWGAAAAVGEAGPSFYVRQAIKLENTKHAARAVSHTIPTARS